MGPARRLALASSAGMQTKAITRESTNEKVRERGLLARAGLAIERDPPCVLRSGTKVSAAAPAAAPGSPHTPRGSPAAFAWMAASATLFALMNFFARLASAHLSWTLVASTRAVIGAGVAYAVARARAAPMTVRNRRGMWWRSGWGTASMLCTFYAVSAPALPLGDSVTLLNLTPIFLAVIAPFFLDERAGRRVLIALPISLAGVVLVVRPPFLFGGVAAFGGGGAAALIVAAVCILGAVYFVFRG